MKLHVIAVGRKMPAWVDDGFTDYQKRLPSECSLFLKEIPAIKASGGVNKVVNGEGDKLLAAIPKNAYVVALEPTGQSIDNEKLAGKLSDWMMMGRDIAFLIGGAEGLSNSCIKRADMLWCLSQLIMPHGLARVFVAEQIYRSWSILKNHPYHRG